jgi:hypothetical protein
VVKYKLLGMRGEGRKEFPDEALPCASTFADNIIVNTSVTHFAGRSGPTQWRSSGLIEGPFGINPGGGPKKHREVTPKATQVPEVSFKRSYPSG